MTQDVILTGTNFSANGNSATMENSPYVRSVLSTYAGANVAFGAGTVKVQMSPDGGTTWLDTGKSFTAANANKLIQHDEVFGPEFRMNLSGATAPNLDVDMVLRGVATGPVPAYEFSADETKNAFTLPFTAEKAFVYAAYGTFGGGTLTLEYSIDGGTTWKAEDTALANKYNQIAAGYTMIAGRDGVKSVHKMYRFKLAGSTAPSLSVRVYG